MNNNLNDNIADRRQQLLPGEDAFGATQDGITFMSVFLAVIKRPWIILTSLLIIITPLVFYLMSISTVYSSSSTVMVSIRESSFLDAVSMVGGTRSDVKPQKYYTSILDSRIFREGVAKQISILYSQMPKDSILRISKADIGYAVNRREPGFLTIYSTSQSKEFAQILTQAALDQFKTRSVTLEREDAIHVSEFINDQVESISGKLEQAEEELQTFLSQKKLIMGGGDAGITQELFELESKHNEAKANLEMVSINIRSYDDQMNELLNKLTDDTKVADEQKIIKLKDRLAEIRRTLDTAQSHNLSKTDVEILTVERDKIRNELIGYLTPASVENNGDSNVSITLQKLEVALEAALLSQTGYKNKVQFYSLQIDRFRRDHPNLSEDILIFASLSRAKEVLQKTLDILLEKREETRIRIESEMGGGIKVMDEPRIPGSPLARKRVQKLIIGIMAALGLGIVISVIFDKFDDAIKDENDIQQSIGISVFGTIPSLDDDKFGGMKYDRYSGKKDKKVKTVENLTDSIGNANQRLLKFFSEKSPIAEAYRSIKINLQFLASDKSKKVFVISSPSASEGKSLTTSNIGISFARGGNKTLIIDCDLRKSVQHKNFGVDRKPGLTNYLYGEEELSDVIVDVGVDNLYVIPAGSSPSNPAGLLASEKMQNLIKELRPKFDFILVDTPPILVCSDSRILSEYVDGMICIVKVESTNIKALEHSIQLTRHLNIEVLGLILNQVDFKFGRAYYYTYRYYKPYSYYSGYYYKRAYYDYTEGEDGEKIKMPKSDRGERRKITDSKKA
jgi:capsular exopolysaccharide synthesis family protein